MWFILADFKKYPVYEDITQLSSLPWSCSWYIVATCPGYSSGIEEIFMPPFFAIIWVWVLMWAVEEALILLMVYFVLPWVSSVEFLLNSVWLEDCQLAHVHHPFPSKRSLKKLFFWKWSFCISAPCVDSGTEAWCWGCVKTWKSCRRAQHSKHDHDFTVNDYVVFSVAVCKTFLSLFQGSDYSSYDWSASYIQYTFKAFWKLTVRNLIW